MCLWARAHTDRRLATKWTIWFSSCVGSTTTLCVTATRLFVHSQVLYKLSLSVCAIFRYANISRASSTKKHHTANVITFYLMLFMLFCGDVCVRTYKRLHVFSRNVCFACSIKWDICECILKYFIRVKFLVWPTFSLFKFSYIHINVIARALQYGRCWYVR